MIEMTIPLAPVAKGRARITRTGHAFTPTKTANAESFIRLFLSQAIKMVPFPQGTPLVLCATFYRPRPKSLKKSVYYPVARPDADNYLKLLLDAGNGLLWHDDSSLVTILVKKRFGEPCIHLRLKESP